MQVNQVLSLVVVVSLLMKMVSNEVTGQQVYQQILDVSQNYSFQYTELDSQVSEYYWCKSDYSIVLLLTDQKTLYRSFDSGKTFTNLNSELFDKAKNSVDFQMLKIEISKIGKVEKIIVSEADHKYMIFKGTENIWWKTRDCGITIEAMIEDKRIDEFKMHITQSEWILMSSYTDCDDFDDNEACWIVRDLFYSKDFGQNIHHVVDYVYDFDWAKRMPFQDEDNWILLTRSSKERQKGHQQFDSQYSEHIDLILTTDYFKTSKVLVEGGNKFVFSSYYILVFCLEDEIEQDVSLLVSSIYPSDGEYKFMDTEFPFRHLKEYGYKVLDAQDSQLMLHVSHQQDNKIGNIYMSDNDGLRFSLSLKNNIKNNDDICDFSKVKSLEAVYISNVVDENVSKNKQIKKRDNYKQTKISFNRGASWNSLQPPKKDHLNRTIDCYDSESCQLHLHSNSNYQFGPFYSTENGIGLVIGTGNVGKYLSNKGQQINTFFSRDGGISWNQIASGSHIYEMANHGGLLLLVDDQELVSQALFSYNEGLSFEKLKFAEKEVYAENVISQPDFKGKHFLIYGKTKNQKGFVSRMDFSNIHQRNCTMISDYSDGNQDYELWSPRDLSQSECVNGAKTQYVRKRRDAQCYNTEEWEQQTKYQVCQCQDTDYECDIGFSRVGDNICKPENKSYNNFTRKEENERCIKGYVQVTQGYRKISGNQCMGGVNRMPLKVSCGGYSLWSIDYSWIMYLVVVGAMVIVCSSIEIPNLIHQKIQEQKQMLINNIKQYKNNKQDYQQIDHDNFDNQMFD